MKLSRKSITKASSLFSKYLPHLYLAAILFGQVFLSSIANVLNVENRGVMIALRFLIRVLSYGYILSHFRCRKAFYF